MPLFEKKPDKTKEEGILTIEGDQEVSRDDIPSELVVLPLRKTVLFPRTIIPVVIDTPRSQKAVEKALAESRFVATFMLKHKKVPEVLTPQDLYSLGTVALIHKVVPVAKGAQMVALQGAMKAEALHWDVRTPIWRVAVRLLEEKVSQSKNTQALTKSLINVAQKVIVQSPFLPREMGVLLEQLEDDPLKLLYTIASLIRLKAGEQQKLLQFKTTEAKLRYLIRLLSRELEFIKLGGKIQSTVKEEFNRAQREAFLRQRLKAIKKELGEEDPVESEVKELQQRLRRLKLPPEARKQAENEIKRLETIHPLSGEHQVIRTYLDWIFSLPWNVFTKDNLDLERAGKILDQDHYDLKEIKERIIEYLAVRKLRQDLKSPIICFVGPPGVGKTSLGKSIARALGRKFVRISLGGVRDEAEIRGHRRTYVGALPGKIIQAIKRAGSNNPVFMLDEIDKIGADFRGDPAAALLEVLDPEQNVAFRDHYLDLDYDLSRVMFIATANVIETMHPALLDRMEIIEIPGYIEEEKVQIARQYLIPRQIKEHGLTGRHIKFRDEVLPVIINEYTKEAGVRGLERQIAKIVRKVARQIAQKERKTATISLRNLRKFLGPQKVFPEVKRRTAVPGVATGLAVTSAGGEIIFVEATAMPGRKRFLVTGSLGKVMKESAQAALSLVRSRAKKLQIKEDFFDRNDIHLHVPAGAVPKDGPSAGVTMFTALASLLSGRCVRNDLAMTGEITLSGLVLPVGGIKQKVLAAKTAGIKNVILPEKNKGHLEELDPELKEGLNFVLVSNVDQVLAHALLPANN